MTRQKFHDGGSKQLPPLTPKDVVKVEFGRRLQGLMTAKGWNQSELARQAGIARDNVSNYVRGEALPRKKHLDALARALNCEPSDLLPTPPGGSVGEAIPQFEVRDLGGNLVLLRMNRTLPFETAVKIAELVSGARFQVQ